jgi:uncharacterized membrane protein
MNSTKITNALNYAAAFLSALVALLIGFDWLVFFTPVQALKIVGALNLIGLFMKAWMVTAEQMAKQIAAGASK